MLGACPTDLLQRRDARLLLTPAGLLEHFEANSIHMHLVLQLLGPVLERSK